MMIPESLGQRDTLEEKRDVFAKILKDNRTQSCIGFDYVVSLSSVAPSAPWIVWYWTAGWPAGLCLRYSVRPECWTVCDITAVLKQ